MRIIIEERVKSIMEHIELLSVCYSDYTRHTIIIHNYSIAGLFPMLQDIGYFIHNHFHNATHKFIIYIALSLFFLGGGVRIGVV